MTCTCSMTLLARIFPLHQTQPVRCAARAFYGQRRRQRQREEKARRLAKQAALGPEKTWLEKMLAKRAKTGYDLGLFLSVALFLWELVITCCILFFVTSVGTGLVE